MAKYTVSSSDAVGRCHTPAGGLHRPDTMAVSPTGWCVLSKKVRCFSITRKA